MNVFDILTAVVAVGALAVSIWAIRVAKSEPGKARTRANRDAVRDALVAVQRKFREADYPLERGYALRDAPDELNDALTLIDELKDRLPERSTLSAIRSYLTFARSEWQNLDHVQARHQKLSEKVRALTADADTTASVGAPEEAARIRTALETYREDLESTANQRMASRSTLGKRIAEARAVIDPYVSSLNSHDRSGTEPA